MKVLVSLIGEQPIPNLLPLKYLRTSSCQSVHNRFTAKAGRSLLWSCPATAAIVPFHRRKPPVSAVPSCKDWDASERSIANQKSKIKNHKST
jgi:hypothetical protein